MQKLQFWLGEEVEGLSHKGIHFDEILAYFLINAFGDREFAKNFLENGKLVLGINGGHFDEHLTGGQRKSTNECCATLVAKALKVENDLALKKLLRYVRRVDIKGHGQPKEIHNIIKLLHQQNVRSNSVLEWAILGINAKHGEEVTGDFTLKGVFKDMKKACQDKDDLKEAANWYRMGNNAFKTDQEAFVTKTKEEYKEKAVVKQINSTRGELTIVVVESDNPQMSKFARSKEGDEADVVIQKNSSDNVQIFTDKRKSLPLDDLARALRYEEQKIRDDFFTRDWNKLCCDGKVHPDKDLWFYLREGKMLLNGSLTATDVEPTKLTLRRIERIIEIALDPSIFNLEGCREGKCIAARHKNECPWYPWGLHRCRKIRYEMINKN